MKKKILELLVFCPDIEFEIEDNIMYVLDTNSGKEKESNFILNKIKEIVKSYNKVLLKQTPGRYVIKKASV